MEERDYLIWPTESSTAIRLVNPMNIPNQLIRLKKNRSPGIDGFTIEHLNSVLLGGDRDLFFRNMWSFRRSL